MIKVPLKLSKPTYKRIKNQTKSIKKIKMKIPRK